MATYNFLKIKDSLNLKKIGIGMIFIFSTEFGWATSSSCDGSAQSYWSKFRSAVLSEGVDSIVDMTLFPFELRGTLDNSEKRKLSRSEFKKLFPTLINSDPGTTAEPSTMGELIDETKRIPARSCAQSGNQFSIGTWLFKKDSGGWRFVQAILEEQ